MIKKYIIVLVPIIFVSCASFLPIEDTAKDIRVYPLPRETPVKSVNDIIQSEYGFKYVKDEGYNSYLINNIKYFSGTELSKERDKMTRSKSFIYFVFFVHNKYIYLVEYAEDGEILRVPVSDKISPQIIEVEIERLAYQRGSQIQQERLQAEEKRRQDAAPAKIPAFLKQSFRGKKIEANKAQVEQATELYNQGWRYVLPSPKSEQAEWGNYSRRTTWYEGGWRNKKTNSYSYDVPQKNNNGKYIRDGDNRLGTWRRGGAPRLNVIECMLAE